MRKPKRPLGFVFLLAVCQPALLASAAPLTFEFGGAIDFVEDGLPISDQIAVELVYAGTYQFDPDGIEDIDPSPRFASYQFGSAGFMSVDIGSIHITTPDLLVFIEDSTLLDRYLVASGSPFIAQSILWQSMAIDLRDTTHTAFDSDALPLYAPDLNDFQFSKLFSLHLPNRRDPSITGTVTYLNMIPEPSTLASLFAAVAVISLRRHRKHRRQNRTEREYYSTPSQ